MYKKEIKYFSNINGETKYDIEINDDNGVIEYKDHVNNHHYKVETLNELFTQINNSSVSDDQKDFMTRVLNKNFKAQIK